LYIHAATEAATVAVETTNKQTFKPPPQWLLLSIVVVAFFVANAKLVKK